MTRSRSTSAVIEQDLPCAVCGYNLRTARRDGRCPECGIEVAETLGTAPDPEPWRAPVSSEGLVEADVHCVGCGYNLRTRPAGGRCPECGLDVAESLGQDIADPAAAGRAMWWLAWARTIGLAAALWDLSTPACLVGVAILLACNAGATFGLSVLGACTAAGAASAVATVWWSRRLSRAVGWNDGSLQPSDDPARNLNRMIYLEVALGLVNMAVWIPTLRYGLSPLVLICAVPMMAVPSAIVSLTRMRRYSGLCSELAAAGRLNELSQVFETTERRLLWGTAAALCAVPAAIGDRTTAAPGPVLGIAYAVFGILAVLLLGAGAAVQSYASFVLARRLRRQTG
jgi:predicted RNA-binding Zn-ribbon protein involved in translation (DUF1610 family)